MYLQSLSYSYFLILQKTFLHALVSFETSNLLLPSYSQQKIPFLFYWDKFKHLEKFNFLVLKFSNMTVSWPILSDYPPDATK